MQWYGSRLVLRSMGAEHARSLADYRSDPEVARHQRWDPPYTLDQARAFVATTAGLDPLVPGRWVHLAIEAHGEHVGDIGVRGDDEGRQARVEVTIARPWQQAGLATEALTTVLRRLFAAGAHRVEARCDTDDIAAIRLLERVGMRREAELWSAAFRHGEWIDCYSYALLASEWRA
ncbi:GNAT family protein [Isoptericola sp. b490]|uniref:GNAT family N-acetyltransferase n=1 Tax=Actinotalea lenta TaxID=3064654 RepID=UPI002713CAB8|nr:GNAT family protein [Isoptericola sp. b490]MDO8121364.1 GNAT family protein [Isoptericola sp. b490]